MSSWLHLSYSCIQCIFYKLELWAKGFIRFRLKIFHSDSPWRCCALFLSSRRLRWLCCCLVTAEATLGWLPGQCCRISLLWRWWGHARLAGGAVGATSLHYEDGEATLGWLAGQWLPHLSAMKIHFHPQQTSRRLDTLARWDSPFSGLCFLTFRHLPWVNSPIRVTKCLFNYSIIS